MWHWEGMFFNAAFFSRWVFKQILVVVSRIVVLHPGWVMINSDSVWNGLNVQNSTVF
jgi:hypothetical protein